MSKNKYPRSGISKYHKSSWTASQVRQQNPDAAIIRETATEIFVFNEPFDAVGHHTHKEPEYAPRQKN